MGTRLMSWTTRTRSEGAMKMLSFFVFLGDLRRVLAIFIALWLVSPGGLSPVIGLPLGIAVSVYALYVCLRRRSSWALLVMALCLPAAAVLGEHGRLAFVPYLIALLVYMLPNAVEDGFGMRKSTKIRIRQVPMREHTSADYPMSIMGWIRVLMWIAVPAFLQGAVMLTVTGAAYYVATIAAFALLCWGYRMAARVWHDSSRDSLEAQIDEDYAEIERLRSLEVISDDSANSA